MNVRPMLPFFIFACFASVASTALAACVTPLFPPMADTRASWEDVEKLKVEPPMVSSVLRRQDIHDLGHGKINLDFFAVTMDANGRTAQQLFAEIRANLNSIIFDGSTYRVEPLDQQQSALWSSSNPLGAVMVFTLAEIPGVMPLERGAVFVACFSSTDMVFSTIEESSAGLHPVAGNRAFGVHDHGNGTLSFFVKAADRVVNAGIFSALPDAGREQIFVEGEAVWLRMLGNVQTRYASRNANNLTIISRREDY